MKPQILIIDDDQHMRDTICAILEEEDYIINEAVDGNAGMDFLHKYPVDLIIVDIIMPDKDGIEVIIETSGKFPDTKILCLSGGGLIDANSHLVTAEALGADKTLVKPFKNNELIEYVSSLLKEKKIGNESR
jgi:DNA-binding response OmpR family regulator